MKEEDREQIFAATKNIRFDLQTALLVAIEVAEVRWTDEDTKRYGTMIAELLVKL